MMEHRVSFRYAKALLESAKKENITDLIYHDFQNVKHTFEMSKELAIFAASPVVQLWRKKKVFNEIFNQEQISKLTMDFMMLLIEKRRGSLILSIIYEYETQYNLFNNRLPIQVSSAVELDDNIKSLVLKKVTDKMNMTILPEYQIDETLKGGILVRIGDWVFDASIRNQLNVLHRTLAEGQTA